MNRMERDEKETTTIQISKHTWRKLGEMKVHPREPFEDVLKRVLEKIVRLKEEGKW